MLLRRAAAAAGLTASVFLAKHALAEPDRLARWRDRWATKQTRWHLPEVHPALLKFLPELFPNEAAARPLTVLFPLCGSSVDLAFIARRGHQVVGVDGVPAAIDELLSAWGEEIALGDAPDAPAIGMRIRVAEAGPWQQKLAEAEAGAEGRKAEVSPLMLAVEGDFLGLDAPAALTYGLASIDAAFDRGSLVAIEPSDRKRYAQILTSLMAAGGRILLVAVEHEPAFGPPHSVDEAEVRRLFGDAFDVKVLSREGRLEAEPQWRGRGATRFDEVVYLCTRRAEVRSAA